MVFNDIINHLKSWCCKRSASYRDKNSNYGGISSIVSTVLWELEFKLSTLIEHDFTDVEDFQNHILNLIDIHYDRLLTEPQNNMAIYVTQKINDEFRLYLSDVLFENGISCLTSLPYRRAIVGDEAIRLIDKFKTVWEYENTSYWFPLMGEKPMHVSEKFFVMFDYLEPYLSDLSKLIGLPDIHIYEYSEEDIWPDHIIETVELTDYGGHETIYTDKDFSWAIYYSHEDTVAFAGAIVPKVKELLKNEKKHWDKFEWN